MTFRERREALGITVSTFAKFSGFNLRTVVAWDSGRAIPEPIRESVLKALDIERIRLRAESEGVTVRQILPRELRLKGVHVSPKKRKPVTPNKMVKLLHDAGIQETLLEMEQGVETMEDFLLDKNHGGSGAGNRVT